MIGGTSISAVFGSLPDGRPLNTLEGAKAYVRALADAELAVLFLHPGTKEPMDPRTPQKKGTDDRAARDAAREAGRPDWERVRSPQGLHLATKDKTALDRYVKRWFDIHGVWEDVPAPTEDDPAKTERRLSASTPGINLAIEVGRSHILVVDCDTRAQVTEFLQMCGAPEDLPPTVSSPGQVGPNGVFEDRSTWNHADGGHFYFTLPEDLELPTEIGRTVIGETGIAVLWHNSYVLIPPSVRQEGFYELTGREYPAPSQLLDVVQNRAAARRRAAEQRAAAHDGDDELGERIDDWASKISWTDILAPIGWVPTSTPDNCGCLMLTAPGDHSSPKSATAHDAGCSLGWWDNDVNAPLHIWTTNPGEPFENWIRDNGLQTVTKFQAVALVEYDGNQAQAMDALGIAPDFGVDIEGIDVTGIATEDADPANLNDDTQANLTQRDGDCEHIEVGWQTGRCLTCDTQIRPPQPEPTPAQEATAGAIGGIPATPEFEQMIHEAAQAAGVADENPFAELAAREAENVGTVLDRMTPDQRNAAYEMMADAYETDPPQAGEILGPVAQNEVEQAAEEMGVPAPEDIADTTPTADNAIDVANMSLRELAGGAPPPVGEDGFPVVGQIDTSSGLYMPINAGVPEMAPFRHWRDMPPPEYVVGGLLEHGGLTCIIGTPGAGKSTLGLDMACHIATGRRWQGRDVLKTRVLYLPGEGLRGVVSRLNAWEESHNASVGDDMIVGSGIIQLGATREAWAELREFVARQGIGLIIFDTFARMATNIDENSATDVGKAIKRFDQIRELTHCGVLVVHHTGKANPDVARGSSALNGALDSELLVRTENERVEIPAHDGQPASWGKAIHLRVTKQKNAEMLDEEISLLMVNWRDQAPIITGPTGTIDPMQGDILLARPVPEPLIETAVRIRAFVDRFTEQGCTRADIAAGVTPDPYTQGLRYTERQWKLKVAEAVDRSLRWGLLQTIEGMSTRYESGPIGPTQAREVAAEEVMVPDVPQA